VTVVVGFEVVGTPVQQGSKRHVGGGRMIEAANGHREWRHAVATEARRVAGSLPDTPLDGPLCLSVRFRFPMPSSRPKRRLRIGIAWKTTAPDLDKLVRAVGDALTDSGLIRDDARIGMVIASKVETTDWSGAEIKLHALDEFEVDR
jgi:Holliday junction resolvase RusA-like endonuclease